MKACITINDVIRRHFKTFEEVYSVYQFEEELFEQNSSEYEFKNLDENFEEEVKKEKKILNLSGEIDPIGLTSKFEFESKEDFIEFLYQNMAFEIFAKTNVTYSDVIFDFLTLQNFFKEKNIELDVVSQEILNSKPATLFFLSREKCQLNNLKFVNNYRNIWDEYQIVITADNYLIENKRPRRKLLKIITENNKHLEQGKAFNTLKEITQYFINNE